MSKYNTPGVYIKEKNTFDNPMVEAETAIPVFIGLTEKAADGSKSLLNQPIKISSLTEYINYFGGPPVHKFNISIATSAEADALSVDCGNDKLQAKLEGNLYTLYYHLTLFFANGGGTCYVLSIGNYKNKFSDKYREVKENIFTAIKKVEDITMLVTPEAVNDNNCMNVYTDLLELCDSEKYFAILDIPTKYKEGVKGDTDIEKFRHAIGTTNLQFAAAYYPWLETYVLSDNDIDGAIMSFIPSDSYSGDVILDECITNRLSDIEKADKNEKKRLRNDLHNTLLQDWPAYNLLAKKVKDYLNLLPSSAAIAGVYTRVDHTRGVWKAPANVSINYVNKPSEVITNEDQEELNMPMNGKSVNAIRTFPGEGIKIWGARTLDGNSQDWRYIHVCRTMIFLEQSVKNAARTYVFEPNDAGTWINMKCMIENFLRSVWKRGGLAGATPEDAYEVHVGLGDTMTAEDILESIMRITVLVAISRPAEFIEITFQQKMQKS